MQFSVKASQFAITTILAITMITQPTPIKAQDSQPVDPEVAAKRREKELAELEKSIAELKKAKAEAEKTDDSDLSAAKRETAIAVAEKEKAVANRETLTANLPSSSTKPLAGEISLSSNAGYYAELLAYRSLVSCAKAIGITVANKTPSESEIYLVSKPETLQLASQLQELELKLDSFLTLAKNVNGQINATTPGVLAHVEVAPMSALSAIPAIIGAVADVAAFFKQDRAIQGRSTSINQSSLFAAIAASLPNRKVILPPLNVKGETPIHAKLKETETEVAKSRELLVKVTRKISAILHELEASEAEVTKKQESVTVAKKEFETISERIEATQKEVEQKTYATGSMPAMTDKMIALIREIEQKEENADLEKDQAIQSARKASVSRMKLLLDKLAVDEGLKRASEVESINRLKAALTEANTNLGAAKVELKTAQTNLVSSQEIVKNKKIQKAKWELSKLELDAVVKAYSEFSTTLMTPDKSGISPITALAESSLLRAGSQFLSAVVSSQGGEVETRKSIWTSGRVYHRAGCVCTFVLFDKDGKIITAGTVTADEQAHEGKLMKDK